MNRVASVFRSIHENEDQRYYSLNKASIMTNSVAESFTSLKSTNLRKVEHQIELTQKNKDRQMPFLYKIYFTPQSPLIIFLSIIKLILIYLYFVEIPITIAFGKFVIISEYHRKEEDSQKVFQLLNIPAISFFIFSIFIKLKTAYYKEGILISDQKSIIIHYFLYSFIFDFLSITSILVYEVAQILDKHDQPISYRFIVVIFYLQIPALLQIQKSIITSFDLNRKTKAFIKLFLLLLKIFMMCNITACGFFYLSDSLCPDYSCVDCCWINQLQIMGKPITLCDWTIQYSFSLYWASTTMISIGYGDITPLNQHEVLYTIAVQFIACFVFAFSINEIWTIIQQMKIKKTKIHHRMNTINIYMRDKNVSVNLKSRVNAYLSNFYHQKNLRQKDLQNEIISELTPSLKKQLYFQSFGFMFKEHSVFEIFSSNFLEKVSQCIKQIGFFEEELVYDPYQQPIDYQLLYLSRGELQNFIQLGVNFDNFIFLGKIKEKSMVGLPEFIKQINYQSSVMALRYSLVYSISFDRWKEYLRENDEDFQRFFQLKHNILIESQTKKLKMRCAMCGEKNHFVEECAVTQLRSQQNQIINKYIKKVNRQQYQRHQIRSSHEFNLHKLQFSRKSSREKSPRHFSANKIRSFKVSPRKNDVVHGQRISRILEKKRLKESVWFEESESDEEMVSQIILSIDKVQNFEKYFSSYNANNDWGKERRRNTMNNLLLFR